MKEKLWICHLEIDTTLNVLELSRGTTSLPIFCSKNWKSITNSLKSPAQASYPTPCGFQSFDHIISANHSNEVVNVGNPEIVKM